MDKTKVELLKLLSAVESSDEAIFITDPEGIITYINPGFTNLYGYTKEEVIGLCTPRILKSGTLSPENYAYFWQTILNKNVVKGELVNKTKSGKIITVEGSANPILDINGKIVGFIGIQHDITERKRVEVALKKSEELFRKSFTTSPDSVNVNRLSDGMYVSVNEGFVKLLGFTEEEVIGKTSLELNIWHDPENRKKMVATIQEKGRLENFEALFRHKDGRLIIGLMSASVIEIEGVPHILNITKDITSRKQIEEALSREQFLISALMDNLPDHVYFKDLESRFVRINKSHAESFGLKDPSEAIGKTDFDFFSKEHAQEAYNDEQAIIHSGEQILKEELLTRTGKPNSWSLSNKIPLKDNNGNIVGTFGISRDITLRKKAEEELAAERNLLRTLIDNMPDRIYAKDINSMFMICNKALVKRMGKTSETEIIGKSDFDFLPHEIAEKYFNQEQVVMRTGEPLINHEETMGNIGGIIRWNQTTKVPLRNSEGKIIGLVGMGKDITDRKRKESEAHVLNEIIKGISLSGNLDELLELIHKSLSEVVYAENCFIALEDKMSGLFYFPFFLDKFDPKPSPVSMRRSCTSYVFRSATPLLLTQKAFDNLLEQDEVELVGSNSPSWVGIPLLKPSGIIGVLVLQHYEKENVYSDDDVKFLTSIAGQIAFAIERKQAELALRNSERDLFESQKIAGLGSYNLNFRTGTWTSSKILDSIFGIDEKYERSVTSWTELIHPDWREKMSIYLQEEVIGQKKMFDKEYIVVRKKDLVERWVHGRGELIFGENGELINMFGNIIDITQRKLTEEEIKLKNELLQAINAEKDKFFSIIAHDLRGPMSAFVEVTKILADDIQAMTLEEIRDIVTSMRDDSANIYSLLENLLEWSRLKRGVMEFNPVKLQLAAIIQSTMNILSGPANAKSIRLNSSVPDSLFITADKHMIETVIRNLISNAVKFTRTGGDVILSANQLPGSTIEISIADTGIGMSPDLKSKLFQINEKTSRPGTAGETSTGLGLLLCKEFVEKHNGRIWVESEEGKGSVFTFTLPS